MEYRLSEEELVTTQLREMIKIHQSNRTMLGSAGYLPNGLST
jgi:hypothetical protein